MARLLVAFALGALFGGVIVAITISRTPGPPAGSDVARTPGASGRDRTEAGEAATDAPSAPTDVVDGAEDEGARGEEAPRERQASFRGRYEHTRRWAIRPHAKNMFKALGMDEDASVGELVARARELDADNDQVELALAGLFLADTEQSRRALVDLFADPAFAEPEYTGWFAKFLYDVDDPRIGPIAAARYEDCMAAGVDSWVTMKPLTGLLARRGGDIGVRLLLDIVGGRTHTSGQGRSNAIDALALGDDPRLLECALDLIRSGHGSAESRWTIGLVESYGSTAVRRLVELAADPNVPKRAREGAIRGVAFAATEVEARRLIDIAQAEPALAPAVWGWLGRRPESEVSSNVVESIRRAALAALDRPTPEVLTSIGGAPLLHGEKMRDRLARAVETETDPELRHQVREALVKVRTTIRKSKR